jgi:hypothetical protein
MGWGEIARVPGPPTTRYSLLVETLGEPARTMRASVHCQRDKPSSCSRPHILLSNIHLALFQSSRLIPTSLV